MAKKINLKNFSKRYVAFLDVLGFSELVYGNSKNELETYYNTILPTLDNLKKKQKEYRNTRHQ